MGSLLGNMVKSNTDINDEVIINTLMASTVGGANAYLNATMAAATPELRAMLASNVNLMIGRNSALGALAMKKGWERPYSSPSQQLAETYDKSKQVVHPKGM
ncbi:spore coat protein [Alkaliphilus transvaalensis]|uniref:spore coat protein n=1 Tax=Alkaliphilus transvaalensis TaxID=114628 RepID=UPI0004797944|nr:spore coat protein [Alkaliphilus transvaalensis]